MLNAQLSRLENYPELSERIRLHIKETKAQAALLTTVLDGHDEGSSTMKHAGGKLMPWPSLSAAPSLATRL
jgi:ferritin-like metal-binding protein YciE